MSLIATLPFITDDAYSKRALLLFDNIYVYAVQVAEIISSTETRETPQLPQQLIESGIVLPYKGPELQVDRQGIDDTSREMASNLTARLGSPVVAVTLGESIMESATSGVGQIVKVVLQSVALPTAESTIDELLEWRGDEAAVVRHRRLRAWIARLTREGTVPHPDELVTLLDDYNVYMEAHFRRMARSRLTVLLTTVAEVAEEVAHLRLSRAANRLLGLFAQEATLLEAELNAPGREIAYIVAADRHFRKL